MSGEMLVCEPLQKRGQGKGSPATGTHAGYMRHRNAGEPPCGECRLGHNAWKKHLYNTNQEYQFWQRQWSKDKRFQSFNMTWEKYHAMLSSQGGGCAICGGTEPGGRGDRFAFDHDHSCCPAQESCGECIRGLLCSFCNTMLGQAGDSPSRLRAGAAYLESWEASRHV